MGVPTANILPNPTQVQQNRCHVGDSIGFNAAQRALRGIASAEGHGCSPVPTAVGSAPRRYIA